MAGGNTNAALKERVTHLESFVGVSNSDGDVALSVLTEQHTIELVDLRKTLDDFMTEASVRITNIIEDVVSLTDIVKINLKCLEDDVAFVKKSVPVHSGAIGKVQARKEQKVEVLKLKTNLVDYGYQLYLRKLAKAFLDLNTSTLNDVEVKSEVFETKVVNLEATPRDCEALLVEGTEAIKARDTIKG
ncbi:hypothetical protein F0562_015458 [Nyssa sinensis]|uniref:Uncharacterized protein n=1 Tax=Nyssa sinensis TaxID=561372 RepID=A0A5J4ZJK0_9ASTE|nr:hypothetical protein F0562_015458 [Nyssa sinensis]